MPCPPAGPLHDDGKPLEEWQEWRDKGLGSFLKNFKVVACIEQAGRAGTAGGISFQTPVWEGCRKFCSYYSYDYSSSIEEDSADNVRPNI